MRFEADALKKLTLLVVSRPKIIDRPNGLRRYEPTLGKTAVGGAFWILALGDRDRDANSLLGLAIGVPGVGDVDVAFLHRLHRSRKKIVCGKPNVFCVAGRRVTASAFQSRPELQCTQSRSPQTRNSPRASPSAHS